MLFSFLFEVFASVRIPAEQRKARCTTHGFYGFHFSFRTRLSRPANIQRHPLLC
jgi:hypothetical protein